MGKPNKERQRQDLQNFKSKPSLKSGKIGGKEQEMVVSNSTQTKAEIQEVVNGLDISITNLK